MSKLREFMGLITSVFDGFSLPFTFVSMTQWLLGDAVVTQKMRDVEVYSISPREGLV